MLITINVVYGVITEVVDITEGIIIQDYIYDFLKDLGYIIDCLNNNPYEIRALKEIK